MNHHITTLPNGQIKMVKIATQRDLFCLEYLSGSISFLTINGLKHMQMYKNINFILIVLQSLWALNLF